MAFLSPRSTEEAAMRKNQARRTALFAFTGVGALVAVVVLGVRASQTLHRISNEAASLRVELAELKATRSASAPPAESVRPRGADTAASALLDPSVQPRNAALDRLPQNDREKLLKQVHEAQVQLLSETFDKESIDSTWKAQAEASLNGLYRKAEFTALDAKVECKSTLCRVQFKYTDPKRGKAAVQRLMTQPPWPGKAFTRNDWQNHDGFTYYGREGKPFPRVDPRTITI